MNKLRNRVQLIGNVKEDPKVESLGNEDILVRFEISTPHTYRNSKNERITNMQWHNIVATNVNAQFIQKYVKKGNELAIDGKLVHRSFEDEEGIKRYITEVIVTDFLKLGS